MLWEPEWFWKNFNLGTEMQISGAFIYNSIYSLDQMKSVKRESEAFEVLYNLSIGIERLAKVAIILIEHDSTINMEEFEKSLITHNISSLIERIKASHKIDLKSQHNKLINLLDKFYKTTRYERYSINSTRKLPGARFGLIGLISDCLDIDITIEESRYFEITPRIREFIGKITGHIVNQLYNIVYEEAHRNRTHTYEIEYATKAFKIFIAREYDFKVERIIQRECFLYLMKSKLNKVLNGIIEDTPLVGLGDYDDNMYINSLFNYIDARQLHGEVEYCYEESKADMKRLKEMEVLGSSYRFYEWEEE